MDELISSFFEQCAQGQVCVGELFYNLHFTINHYLDDTVPVIKGKNKEQFYNYIKEFISLFNLTSDEDILKKLVYLFSNLSFSDFSDVELYIKHNIDFVKNRLLKNKNIPFLDEEITITTCEYYQESPYCFISCITNGHDKYELPIISYGISDGICYIFAVQDKNLDKNSSYGKKIKRLLYKINSGVYEAESLEYKAYKENKSSYYPENISDVSPSAVLSLSIFLKQLFDEGITKVKVVPFLPIRYNAKKKAYQLKIDYLIKKENLNLVAQNELKQQYADEHLRIQNNLTQKFLRNFFRINYHFPNVSIWAYPFDYDEYLYINLGEFVKSDDVLNTMVLGVEKKLK